MQLDLDNNTMYKLLWLCPSDWRDEAIIKRMVNEKFKEVFGTDNVNNLPKNASKIRDKYWKGDKCDS